MIYRTAIEILDTDALPAGAGQMVESLRGAPDSQDPLVTLFSVFSCLGRLAFGYLPEHFLHVRGTPR